MDPNPNENSLGPKVCSQPLGSLDFGASLVLDHKVNPPYGTVDVLFPRTCNRGSHAIIALEFSLAKLIGQSVPLATRDCIFFAHFLSLPQILAKPTKVESWSNMEGCGP